MLTEKKERFTRPDRNGVLSYGHRPEAAFSTHRWPRQWLSARSLTIHQPGAVSARWCHVCASGKHSLEDSPKFCNRQDLGRVVMWP